MLPYFPFGETFDPGMGGRVLRDDEPLIEVDDAHYRAEIALKRAQLEQHPREYFHAPADSLPAQWEIARLLLTDLAKRRPHDFRLTSTGNDCRWENRLLEEQVALTWGDPSSLPLAPLDWVGRQVQEDLVLVAADESGTFQGGQLCFPNGWDIPERLGHAFMAMHVHTPGSTMPSVQAGGRLLAGLRPGKVFCRVGWNLKLTSQLDLSTKHRRINEQALALRAPRLTGETAGREIFIRIERQTFIRLESSPHILFGIHTYVSSVEEEARDPQRARRLLNVLSSAPDSVRRYKVIDAVEHALFPYLRGRLESRAATTA